MADKTRKQHLLEFLEADPSDSFSRHALGLELLAEGDREGACTAFAEVVARDPRYLPAYYQLGQAHDAAGRTEQAREAWRSGLEVASAAKDWHTYDELQGALDGLE